MIYLLKRRRGENEHDEMHSIAVRATCETEARIMANNEAQGEGKIWGDRSQVDCYQIAVIGESMVLCKDILEA